MLPGTRCMYRTWNPIPIKRGKASKRNLPNWPVGTAYCMHDTAAIMEERLIRNMKNPAMIFRERCDDSCDWCNTNNCTLLMLNRELTNLIQNPAMRLRRRINRGIQAGKRSHRTIRKAQNVEISVEPWRWLCEVFSPKSSTDYNTKKNTLKFESTSCVVCLYNNYRFTFMTFKGRKIHTSLLGTLILGSKSSGYMIRVTSTDFFRIQ